MKYDNQLNQIQSQIMAQLYTRGDLRFAQMNAGQVPSDQFSYHVRQLLKYGLVEKTAENTYRLSVNGRSRAILLDVQTGQFIEQGFVACRVVLSRERAGSKEYLVQYRTKVPYKGNIAEPGGKILFGEDILQSAARNMLKETGLTCRFVLKGMAHFKDEYLGRIVQDKFFFVILARNPQGELLEYGETGTNVWMTLEQIAADPMSHQGVVDMFNMAEREGYHMIEQTHTAELY